MMKILFLILAFIFSVGLFAQPGSDSLRIESNRIGSGITVGTSFISAGNGKTMYCSYFAPHVEYDLTSRFRINVGGMLVNTNLFGVQPDETSSSGYAVSNGAFSTFLYLSGSYELSSKLVVSGTVFKSVRSNSYSSNSPVLDIYELGLEYKFNDNFSVGIEMKYINSNMPIGMFSNPYAPQGSFLMPSMR
ncbi:MAG: hypothetical protein A2W91_07800 [Bacteroidetes bacterium GWF2_38_335]|nr:MAG: hypothetical protein A2W91_07800 [Bacteroidetes bacterium GWF2_38_335]OFY79044.1 MAG: hypothetical protein A2281_02920 [Bacteroidetes bacterium RIFOXYA12_FULL_38_20]HBS86125.1 hypothetical protein [Bacteroidales bacterium]